MGNYASTTDLKARFEDDASVAYLTDTADSGTPDEDVLNEVIDHAEGQADSYVARRYKVPLIVAGNSVLTAMMKSATLDIAQYHLYGRGRVQPKGITTMYEAAIAWLRDVSKGVIVLPSAGTEPSTTSRDPLTGYGTAGTSDSSLRIFSRATQSAL